MTVRIDPRLLAALKKRARRNGLSVSAEVLRLIRNEVEAEPARRPLRTMGMFPDFDAPDLETFLEVRRAASASLFCHARARRHAR